MKITQKSGFAGAGLLTAAAASLCCITPILALFTGVSGVASTFSWMEPFRPVLIAITLAVLAFAWYQKLKPRPVEPLDCACDDEEKPSYFQSRTFLSIVTVFALAMLAFPYYGQLFYPSNEGNKPSIQGSAAPMNLQQISFKVRGMTCQSCEKHIEQRVGQLKGIGKVRANSVEGTASVSFDASKTSREQLVEAINSTGYLVQTQIK